MNFGEVLELIKKGYKLNRKGWNGKGMYIMYVHQGTFSMFSNDPMEVGKTCILNPFIVMKTVDDKFVPWLASQTDLLTDDWEIYYFFL